MSQRTIELHHRAVAAMASPELLDELFEDFCAPDFEMENTSTAVTDKTYRGIEGVREWIRDFYDAFDEHPRYETEQILADGDDFVVAVVRLAGHGARSGAPLVLRWVNVLWFERDKMTRAIGYLSRRDALESVGLAE